ncbi:GNAT family N-acetyltransferase [Hazenella sp. IB182357]|uniref:GNAT family N-acetyltransferase n=1 Tax=Polycladospora coralii TaxID=2771432 RepID=A0A926RTJ4_9BACL|nr:GNAT family N-acetyltransferase [Polycladospora coralii]MBD1371432.1 GNAT family N-acetyltransferase [Polycladospora coralii]MBS7530400.1 GNAT family N-acetyltransferase [Polycladospora coralii]
MNPILLDFPHEFETERLLIRMPKPGDGKAVYHALTASLNELKPWLPFAHGEQSEQKTEINIREAHIKFLQREDLRFLVFHKDTGQFVCSSGLHRINWDVPKFEIGYWTDTRFTGKGYTTEAVVGITNFAFTELKAQRVEIRCDPNNIKSRAIAKKLNFVLEGTLRKDTPSADGSTLCDTCIYAKITP